MVKSVRDIAQTLPSLGKKQKQLTIEESISDFEIEDLAGHIIELEEQMKEAARNLEFEHAAELRDEIAKLKKQFEGIEQ